jgi:hypothetical protein
MTEKGELRVWWIPQIPMDSFYVKVESIKEAKKMLDVLARYDIFQFDNNVKGDYSNVGGIQEFDGTEWLDWESPEGESIDEVEA